MGRTCLRQPTTHFTASKFTTVHRVLPQRRIIISAKCDSFYSKFSSKVQAAYITVLDHTTWRLKKNEVHQTSFSAFLRQEASPSLQFPFSVFPFEEESANFPPSKKTGHLGTRLRERISTRLKLRCGCASARTLGVAGRVLLSLHSRGRATAQPCESC